MSKSSKAVSRWTRCVLGVLILAVTVAGCSEAAEPLVFEEYTETAVTEQTLPTETTQVTTAPETTEQTTVPTETETQPQPVEYMLTFAGDCTLATDHTVYGYSGTLVQVVGDDYGYPFRMSLPYFESDDFTLVNLECVFSDYNVPEDKQFRFRAPPAYAKILTAGSVEAVNLANNHSYDYGYTGYTDTKAALEAEKITYVENLGTAMYTTESGLRIGMYAAQFYTDFSVMTRSVAKLRADGAEIIIVSYHGGSEGAYSPDSYQQSFAKAAIDAGADIFYGHHPHVLQPVEYYNDGVIYYSVGNYSFGGNINPSDKDTVVIRQSVIREPDGSVHLGETTTVPFCISSVSYVNDYMPTPYSTGSAGWERVMAKLNGTYSGSSQSAGTTPEETEATTAPTQATTQATEPEETTLPTEAPEPTETTQTPTETQAPTETQTPPVTEVPPVTEEPSVTEAPPVTEAPQMEATE